MEIVEKGTIGYNLVNLGLKIIRKRESYEFSIQNVSNEIVKIHGSGFVLPGRSIVLMINF